MLKKLQQQTSKHRRLNEFKSHLNPGNQTCHEFVKLNKGKTFEKFSEKMLEYVKELENKGIKFSFYFNVLVFFMYGT